MEDFEPSLKRPRRHYLHKRQRARSEFSALESSWQAMQEAEPGTSLPASFPAKAQLAAVGYTTVEDLDGANIEELTRQGLTSRQAEAILAALAPLL